MLAPAVWMLRTPFIWNKKKLVLSWSRASLIPHVTFLWQEVLIMSSKCLPHYISKFVFFTILWTLYYTNYRITRYFHPKREV
jgi:hypothetical protein